MIRWLFNQSVDNYLVGSWLSALLIVWFIIEVFISDCLYKYNNVIMIIVIIIIIIIIIYNNLFVNLLFDWQPLSTCGQIGLILVHNGKIQHKTHLIVLSPCSIFPGDVLPNDLDDAILPLSLARLQRHSPVSFRVHGAHWPRRSHSPGVALPDRDIHVLLPRQGAERVLDW